MTLTYVSTEFAPKKAHPKTVLTPAGLACERVQAIKFCKDLDTIRKLTRSRKYRNIVISRPCVDQSLVAEKKMPAVTKIRAWRKFRFA